MPSFTTSKEVLAVGRRDYWRYCIILKDWTVVFDHTAIPDRKLLDMTIFFEITRPKIFTVTGDHDWSDLTMNVAEILDDFLLSDVYLFLTPFTFWNKQIVLDVGQYHWQNIARHNMTVVFGDFSQTDRHLHQFFPNTNEQALAWADFNKFASHSNFLN
jgi:hypothetical protein